LRNKEKRRQGRKLGRTPVSKVTKRTPLVVVRKKKKKKEKKGGISERYLSTNANGRGVDKGEGQHRIKQKEWLASKLHLGAPTRRGEGQMKREGLQI